MSTSDFRVKTLYSISFNQLCESMSEDTLKYAMKWLPSSICMQIIWKIVGVDDCASYLSAEELGCGIAYFHSDPVVYYLSPDTVSPEIYEHFANNQQTKFVDRLNFSSLFDLQLFFKLVEVTSSRNHLFTLFQICVQIKGFNFPSNFAQEWINMEKTDSNEGIYLPDIEKGLKLGIFLGDAGWFVESALVLSHTYNIITTKWVCHDRDLELLKTLQCLTKWLLVVSNYYNFNEAKVVLPLMLQTIDSIEPIEEKTLCVSYAYLAVSQYYYVLLEFDKSWSWAVKAILEPRLERGAIKIMILSHSIKVCCALYKFKTARKLIKQLRSYQNEIYPHINIDLLLSDANYLFHIECSDDGIGNYYIALDTARNLFGYYNLHTANILVNYAFIQYQYDNLKLNIDESLWCIIQAIFIMKKIGVQNDNMLLVIAYQIKSLILQEIVFNIRNPRSNFYIGAGDNIERINQIDIIKESMFNEIEEIRLNAIQVTTQSLEENTLLTAKIYGYIGTLYIRQKKYTESEEMFLKDIEITKSILGTDNVEVAMSISHLAHLYSHHLNKLQEAELLFLQTIKIYESISVGPNRDFESDIKGLINTYKELQNVEKYNHYTDYLETVITTHDTCFEDLQSDIIEENCVNIDLSLEKFKCILNGCSCSK